MSDDETSDYFSGSEVDDEYSIRNILRDLRLGYITPERAIELLNDIDLYDHAILIFEQGSKNIYGSLNLELDESMLSDYITAAFTQSFPKDRKDILRYLRSEGYDLPDLLIYARDPEQLEELFEKDWKITPENNDILLKNAKGEMLRTLFKYGAYITEENNDILLENASCNPRTMEILFRHGAKITPANNDILLIKNGKNDDCMRILQNKGLKATKEKVDKLLELATDVGSFKFLIENGAKITSRNETKLLAININKLELLKLCFANNAHITSENNDELLLAVEHNNINKYKIFEVLFQNKAKINAKINNKLLIKYSNYYEIYKLFFDNGAFINDKNNDEILLHTTSSLLLAFLFEKGAEINPKNNDRLLLGCVYNTEALEVLLENKAEITPSANDKLLKEADSKYTVGFLLQNGAYVTAQNNDFLLKGHETKKELYFLFEQGMRLTKAMLVELVKEYRTDSAFVKELIDKYQKKEEYKTQLFNIYKPGASNKEIREKCVPDTDLMSAYEYKDDNFPDDIYIVKDEIAKNTYRCYTLAELKYMIDNDHQDLIRGIHKFSDEKNIDNKLWSDVDKLVNSNFSQEENYCEYLFEVTKDENKRKDVISCLNYVTSEFPYRDSINWLMGSIESDLRRGRGIETPLTLENLEKYIGYLKQYMDIRFDSLSNLTVDQAVAYVTSAILDYIVNSGKDRKVIFNNLNVAFSSLKDSLGSSSPQRVSPSTPQRTSPRSQTSPQHE